ncbi:MAG: hypothetical protein WAN46_12800 [Gammaproteobacteria bacterium]
MKQQLFGLARILVMAYKPTSGESVVEVFGGNRLEPAHPRFQEAAVGAHVLELPHAVPAGPSSPVYAVGVTH